MQYLKLESEKCVADVCFTIQLGLVESSTNITQRCNNAT